MNQRIDLINLYDLYKKLLTEKQSQYFEKYYFEDESLSEISQFFNVSRSLVQKTIKTVELKLYYYEEIIGKNKLREYIQNIKDKTIKKDLENLL